MKKIITILIPIHNRLIVTKQGLLFLTEALEEYYSKNSFIKFIIIVIDDGSTDGSSKWINQNYPYIKIINGDGNLWWSGAINIGAKYAIDNLKSDFILLWNDDVIPGLNYFQNLEFIIRNKNLTNTIIGSKIAVYNNPDEIWSLGGYFNKLSGKAGMYTNTSLNSEYLECDWQPGMGTLIPTSIIVNFNIWWDNKNFPQYHGDADFILSCKKRKIKIITNLKLVLYNRTEFTGETSKKNLKELYRGLTSIRSFYNINKDILFYSKHGYIPFAYTGMMKKYILYIGGYVKHSIFKN